MKPISRRDFLKGSLATAVGAVGMASGLGNLTAHAESAEKEEEVQKEFAALEYAAAEAAKEEETDVVVIGIGVSGTTAAAGAADKGCKVIAIDRATGFMATNNINTTGAWHCESSEQLKYEGYLTKKEAFDHIMAGTNYQTNARLLRNMLDVSGRAIDIIINSGVPMMFPFAAGGTDVMSRGGHAYAVYGMDRVPYLQKIFDDRPNIEMRWCTQATNLLMENGAVVGVLTRDDNGNTSKIRAKSVVVATGGFLQNKEMVAKYFGGTKIVPMDNKYNDGEGVQLLQNAGAQIGKNFTISMSEIGAGNFKPSPQFAWTPEAHTNATFYFPYFGTMLVSPDGERFIDESRMCESAMFCGESAMREGTYYTIVDQDTMDQISTQTVLDFVGETAQAHMAPLMIANFSGVVLDYVYDHFEEAVSQDWAFKADTIEELAEHYNMPRLVKTVETYNEACESGVDDRMYTPASYLRPIKKAPFYMVEYNPCAWVSLGGIKTDGHLSPLTSDGRAIPNVYVCGADADLWSVPYYQGGSGMGFSLTSGLLAGESAADNALM